MKPLITLAAFALLTAPTLAQTLPEPHTPPSGKFNTTNYPDDRKAIKAMRLIDGLGKNCSDDYVTVGPEGKSLTASTSGNRGSSISDPRLSR